MTAESRFSDKRGNPLIADCMIDIRKKRTICMEKSFSEMRKIFFYPSSDFPMDMKISIFPLPNPIL